MCPRRRRRDGSRCRWFWCGAVGLSTAAAGGEDRDEHRHDGHADQNPAPPWQTSAAGVCRGRCPLDGLNLDRRRVLDGYRPRRPRGGLRHRVRRGRRVRGLRLGRRRGGRGSRCGDALQLRGRGRHGVTGVLRSAGRCAACRSGPAGADWERRNQQGHGCDDQSQSAPHGLSPAWPGAPARAPVRVRHRSPSSSGARACAMGRTRARRRGGHYRLGASSRLDLTAQCRRDGWRPPVAVGSIVVGGRIGVRGGRAVDGLKANGDV